MVKASQNSNISQAWPREWGAPHAGASMKQSFKHEELVPQPSLSHGMSWLIMAVIATICHRFSLSIALPISSSPVRDLGWPARQQGLQCPPPAAGPRPWDAIWGKHGHNTHMPLIHQKQIVNFSWPSISIFILVLHWHAEAASCVWAISACISCSWPRVLISGPHFARKRGQCSRTGFGHLCCTSRAICSSSTLTSPSRQQLCPSKQQAGFFRCDCDFVGYPLYICHCHTITKHSAMPVTLASTAGQEHWSRNLSWRRTWHPSSSGEIWPEAASSYPTSRQAGSSWMPFEANWWCRRCAMWMYTMYTGNLRRPGRCMTS